MLTFDRGAVNHLTVKSRMEDGGLAILYPPSSIFGDLFVIAFLGQLIDDTGVDKRRGIGRRVFGSIFLDRFQRGVDGIDLRPVIFVDPTLELIVSVFGLVARTAKVF